MYTYTCDAVPIQVLRVRFCVLTNNAGARMRICTSNGKATPHRFARWQKREKRYYGSLSFAVSLRALG